MDFHNETPASAKLLKNGSPTSPKHMMGCVIARATYRVSRDGTLERTPAEAWPVGVNPEDTPLGEKPGDRPFLMGGIDVLVGGTVHAPNVTERLEVVLEVGRVFRRRIVVTGDRFWVEAPDGQLVPSPPKPFRSMPLSPELTFGGKAQTPFGMAAPYSANPAGRGYHGTAADAKGQPLPNLEHPAHLVERWDDRPMPVGLGYYPAEGALRALYSVDHPAMDQARTAIFTKGGAPPAEPPAPGTGAEAPIRPEQIRPTLFNQAHPDMILEAGKGPKPGDHVRLSHGRPGGEDLAFTLPEDTYHLHVQLHEREHLVPMVLDQIGILAGQAKIVLGYRAVFEYRTHKGERRSATLHPGPMPLSIPLRYRRSHRDEWDDDWWNKLDA